jgi:sortase A
MALVLFVVLAWIGLNFHALKEQFVPQAETTVNQTSVAPDPNRLEATTIGLVGRVLYPKTTAELNKSLDDGINHMPESSVPENNLGVFLTAHSSSLKPGPYRDIFSNINKLNIGDIIFLYRDGTPFKYTVSSKKIIAKEAVGELSAHRDLNQLVLITCWPIGTDLQRYIVVANREE